MRRQKQDEGHGLGGRAYGGKVWSLGKVPFLLLFLFGAKQGEGPAAGAMAYRGKGWSFFWGLAQKAGDLFGFEAGEGAEFFYCDKATPLLSIVLTDAGQKFARSAAGPAGDVFDIFGVDDDTVRYGIHSMELYAFLRFLFVYQG